MIVFEIISIVSSESEKITPPVVVIKLELELELEPGGPY
jgi:hypothetical protein